LEPLALPPDFPPVILNVGCEGWVFEKGVDWVVEEFVVVESELGELSYVVEEGGAS
jgi:hypothetical protein